MELNVEQLTTLRHMLGIDTPMAPRPEPYRDYYCANPGDRALHTLMALGAVEIYSTRGGYEWFTCTAAGRHAAMASHATIRKPKSDRVYSKFLEVRDALPDLTFKAFLTDPRFKETRNGA